MLTRLLTLLCFFIMATFADAQSVSDETLRRIYTPILMYHYISPLPADADDIRVELTVEPHLFRTHLQYLRDNGYSTISLYELNNALLVGAPLPEKPVILTFDDGHIDHYTYVFPMLKEFGFTGTFFIITEFADQNRYDYLSWAQIQEMAAAGMSMEPHTKSHVHLTERDRDFLVYQILGSLESLGAHLSTTPQMFAYPAGRYDDATLNILSELYIARAVTTQRGVYHTTDNKLEIPRLRISGNMSVFGLEQLLNSGL